MTQTENQRTDALERANEVRTARADFKRCARRVGPPASAQLALERLQCPGRDFETMPVDELLRAVRHVGSAKSSQWLRRAQVSHSKQLGALSDRQRQTVGLLLQREIARHSAPGRDTARTPDLLGELRR